MNACWILVADAGRARIFNATTPIADIEEVEDLVDPSARQPGHDLGRDSPGRAMDRARGGHTAFQPRQQPHEHAAIAFARRLAGRLAEAHRGGQFARLYLVAPPAFLGHLRAALDPALRACVDTEVGKDLTRMPLAEIRAYLPKRL